MKNIIVLSGAGISAESGVKTFRDENGLWEGHDVREVASPEGFKKNPELVLDFYNQRRRQLKEIEPNQAHHEIVLLDEHEDNNVFVITQNVDNLHERAGSKQIIHLHGELQKVRPVNGNSPSIEWTEDLHVGDVDEHGVQLRPDIVWFGEQVPNFEKAHQIALDADALIVVGTSLEVYPAASIVELVPRDIPIFHINPQKPPIHFMDDRTIHIQEPATIGMKLVRELYFN